MQREGKDLALCSKMKEKDVRMSNKALGVNQLLEGPNTSINRHKPSCAKLHLRSAFKTQSDFNIGLKFSDSGFKLLIEHLLHKAE